MKNKDKRNELDFVLNKDGSVYYQNNKQDEELIDGFKSPSLTEPEDVSLLLQVENDFLEAIKEPDSEKDKRVMETLDGVLATKHTDSVNLEHYYHDVIKALLHDVRFAYRTFTLKARNGETTLISRGIMDIINAITLGIINEIEFVNPISISVEENDVDCIAAYRVHTSIIDNLQAQELLELYPRINVRYNYLECLCKEYGIKNKLFIENKQLVVKYYLPIGNVQEASLSTEMLFDTIMELTKQYLDLYVY
ncbi:MAG: hypothetical protein IJ004_04605 [Clostridia bacterium]|nr:hypothetical protein [Clostridia bacterium]